MEVRIGPEPQQRAAALVLQWSVPFPQHRSTHQPRRPDQDPTSSGAYQA